MNIQYAYHLPTVTGAGLLVFSSRGWRMLVESLQHLETRTTFKISNLLHLYLQDLHFKKMSGQEQMWPSAFQNYPSKTTKQWLLNQLANFFSVKQPSKPLMTSHSTGWFIWILRLAYNYVGVSKNRGTPKWMVYNGKPY